jgi:hypothetical protein
MKKLYGCMICLVILSCTVHRNIQIENKTEMQLKEFYSGKSIESFLIVKDFNSFKTLNDSNRITIPQNIVFDENGFEIEHFNEKICANLTLDFLKNYNSKTELKLTKYNIRDYLKNFVLVDSKNLKIEDVIEDKCIRIFVNSATYGEKLNVNQEAFEIYNNYKDKFKIYVVNLDVGTWNSSGNN